MTGNRKVFEEAMRAAANVAWEGNWGEAAKAYHRALAEFPENVDALAGLGMAYASVGRLEDALDAYQRASAATPDDPVLLERIAKTQEQLDDAEAAAKAYLAAADQYADQQQAPRLALACWENAARVHPVCVDAHVALLKYYQRHGRVRDAVKESLTLARVYRDRGRVDYAIQICQHALRLSPRNSEALALLDKLRYGKPAAEPRRQAVEPDDESADDPAPRPEPEPLADIELPEAGLDRQTAPGSGPEEERGSPVETTRRKALTDLAESVFEEDLRAPAATPRLSKEAIDALISRAIDFQTRGKVDDAIVAYEKVSEANGDRPAVHFNLGLLYQEKLRFEDAIDQFERAVSYPDYKLGSHFALGECYRARGRIDDALEHFIQVLKIVDLATVEREHADDLIQLYEHLADGYIVKGDQDQALEFANSLVTFLNEQGWEDKVKQARQRLDALTQEGPAVSLAEALTIPCSERILESIALSQEYVKRSMFYTALEECHYALESASNYLPIHRQLAEILLKMGKVDEAVAKFVAIADTYRVRGSVRQAAVMYEHALKLAPMNTAVRAKLIDLLISHGEIEQALQHHLILADSYYHLAQMDQAREVYEGALRLVPRVDREREWAVRILHKIGDIDMQRVDWKHAVGVYERIRDLAPEDERAHLTLMELYRRLRRSGEAIKELDDLLQIYREQDRMDRVFAILRDAVERWPDVIPFRARLAQAYLDAGRGEEALEQLDKLGDLQLEAGREREARATIRAIVALRPPNVDDYQFLLERLESSRL